MSQEVFVYHCNLCGKDTTLDHEDPSFTCLCQNRPKGMSQYNHCPEHKHFWWSNGYSECIKCVEVKANHEVEKLNQIHVNYQTFGEGWPKNHKPVNHFEREGQARERAHDLEQKRIKQEQAWKKAQRDSVYALVELPKLLKSINSKLDELLKQKEGEFIVNE